MELEKSKVRLKSESKGQIPGLAKCEVSLMFKGTKSKTRRCGNALRRASSPWA